MTTEKQAVQGKRGTVFFVLPEQLTMVTDPSHALYQARVHLPLKPQLVRRMAQRGCKSILKVRKDGEQLLIVDGRQRYKSAVEANKLRVAEQLEPILLKIELEQGELNSLALLGEELNALRFEDDPVTRAKSMRRMLDLGHAEEEVAESFGLGVPAVRWNLRLLDCTPRVQQAVTKRQLAPTEAVNDFSKLAGETQDEKLDQTKLTVPEEGTGKPRRRRRGSKQKRPAPVFVRRVADEGVGLTPAVREALLWASGGIKQEELVGALGPAIEKLLGVQEKKPAKKKRRSA